MFSRDTGHYIMDKNHRLQKTDLHTWAMWFATHDRRVDITETSFHNVSTVFIGLVGDLFETMIWEKSADTWRDEQWRYSGWEEAKAGHRAAVDYIRAIEDGAIEEANKMLAAMKKREDL